ncbi:MAG: CBS domain-containing protein [Armatimonadota bacterium]|nr:CBS domain-containing protein [Armatimonadota bacterium]MDR7451099.1 CBS domain-containing protein [Armatimonadota bacterium]MDR7467296.1 CBS domain-containing protein [Armatimonadota bacterium]MDR7494557.1 CBS domain-containing protein [Armatimonadota bacterium]MDR7499866.1 CBS domain-containing protein [Armatimonadota bacterium]
MKAREIMTTDVVTLKPTQSVEEATMVLLRRHIHGAPVVGDDGRLAGMVNFMDLKRHAGEERTIGDVMWPAVAVDEEASVQEVAAKMLEEKVRRVVVLRQGRVAGIISATDIVRLFLDLHEEPRRG